MNYLSRHLILSSLLLMLSACGGSMPQLFWDAEDGQTRASDAGTGTTETAVEAPIAGSPQQPAGRELPMAEQVGARAGIDQLPEKYRKLLAGVSVTMDRRSYSQSVADLFSATVDAMISLNYPVESVDSSSGVLTSDWVRIGDNSLNMPGVEAYTRQRFIVHIYRDGMESNEVTRLEVHVIGQVYEKSQWVDRPLKHMAEELFVAVDEQLARMQH